MPLGIRIGDTITGTYETTGRTVTTTDRVTSIHGDYVYIPDPRGGTIPIHRKNITHVNNERV